MQCSYAMLACPDHESVCWRCAKESCQIAHLLLVLPFSPLPSSLGPRQCSSQYLLFLCAPNNCVWQSNLQGLELGGDQEGLQQHLLQKRRKNCSVMCFSLSTGVFWSASYIGRSHSGIGEIKIGAHKSVTLAQIARCEEYFR